MKSKRDWCCDDREFIRHFLEGKEASIAVNKELDETMESLEEKKEKTLEAEGGEWKGETRALLFPKIDNNEKFRNVFEYSPVNVMGMISVCFVCFFSFLFPFLFHFRFLLFRLPKNYFTPLSLYFYLIGPWTDKSLRPEATSFRRTREKNGKF